MLHLLVFMIEFLLNITVRKHFIEFFNLFFSLFMLSLVGEKRGLVKILEFLVFLKATYDPMLSLGNIYYRDTPSEIDGVA